MSEHYEVTVVASEMCGADIAHVRLSRPDGYRFAAGQWFRLTLETADGSLTETFSHASAPYDVGLELVTRLSGSAFKRALAEVRPGQRLQILGPGGRLALPDAEKIAFLVGGVGITPVRSMLRDALHSGRTFGDALLLYGNRDESCVPFGEELLGMAEGGVRTVLSYERPSAEWEGESGFITAEMARRYLPADDGRPFVVTGPPVMVAAMEAVLDELGVGDDRRVVERFGSVAK